MFKNFSKILILFFTLLIVETVVGAEPNLLNPVDRHKLAKMISSEKDRWQLTSSRGVEFEWNGNSYKLFAQIIGGKLPELNNVDRQIKNDIDSVSCFNGLTYSHWSPAKVLANKGDIVNCTNSVFIFDNKSSLLGLDTQRNVSIAWVYYSLPNKKTKYLAEDPYEHRVNLPSFAFNIKKVNSSRLCLLQ